MAQKTRVVVVGASGVTGMCICHALLEHPDIFEVQALARPQSLEKPEYHSLASKGVKIISADLSDVSDQLVSDIKGADVVISCLILTELAEMNNLALACHQAQVGRYVPSFFGPITPRGVTDMRDMKEGMLDFIKQMYLPYTVIDIGWWYQMSMPSLPSGKLDGRLRFPAKHITGDGNVKTALIDNRDIGKYVVRIIQDPRTLNRDVFIYNEIWTENDILNLVEKISGETLPRNHLDGEYIRSKIEEGKKSFPDDQMQRLFAIATLEYDYSRIIRGDNMPEKAKYLGYLIGKELYPDITGTSLHDFVAGVVDGTVELPYVGRY